VADLTITAASVVAGEDADFFQATAGETLTAGMPVYLDSTTNQLLGADCTDSMDTAEVKGIALHAASLDQPLRCQTAGEITIGATVVLSTIYILSDNGLICPAADLASGDYTTIIGVASSATKLRLNIFPSHALKA
jgi:hypothetical protein